MEFLRGFRRSVAGGLYLSLASRGGDGPGRHAISLNGSYFFARQVGLDKPNSCINIQTANDFTDGKAWAQLDFHNFQAKLFKNVSPHLEDST